MVRLQVILCSFDREPTTSAESGRDSRGTSSQIADQIPQVVVGVRQDHNLFGSSPVVQRLIEYGLSSE